MQQSENEKQDRSITGWWYAIYLIVILIAAFPRLYDLQYVSITNDEGSHGQLAKHIRQFQMDEMPVAGLPSIGIRNTAFFIYILSIPYFVAEHPLAGVYFIALLNILTIWITMAFVAKRFHPIAALFTGILFTISPWSVLYARNMWPPSCTAILSIICLSSAYRWVEHSPAYSIQQKKSANRSLFLFVLCVFMLPAMHFSGAVVGIWAFVFLCIHFNYIRWMSFLFAVICGILVWSPWLYFQFVSLEQNELFKIGSQLKEGHTILDTLLWTMKSVVNMNGVSNFEWWFGKDPGMVEPYRITQIGIWKVIQWTVAAILIIGSLIFWCKTSWQQNRRSLRDLSLVLWLIVPIVCLLVIKPKEVPHYIFIAYPVVWIFAGVFLQYLWDMKHIWLRSSIVVAILASAILNGVYLSSCYRYLKDGNEGLGGHFELSYAQRKRVAEKLIAIAGEKKIKILGSFSNCTAPAYDFVYQYELYLSDIKSDFSTDYYFWLDEEEGDIFGDAEISSVNQYANEGVIPHGLKPVAVWRLKPSRIVLLIRYDVEDFVMPPDHPPDVTFE